MTTTPPWRQALACLLPALLAGLCSSGSVQAQSIATGSRHGLALQADGSVLAWGDNRLAQLGQGRTMYANSARQIALPAKASAVRASSTGVLLLDADGNVWSWGTNRKGQLGDGTSVDRAQPKLVFRGATEIVNGGDFGPSFAIDKDGQPWWWGPLPSGIEALVPVRAAQVRARLVRIEHRHPVTMALDSEGVVWSWGEGVACAASPAMSEPVAMRDLPPIKHFVLTAYPGVRTTTPGQPTTPPRSMVYAQARDGTYWQWGTTLPSWADVSPPSTFCPPTTTPAARNPASVTPQVHPELVKAGTVFTRVFHSSITTLGLTPEGVLWRWLDVTTQGTSGSRVTLYREATDVVDAAGYTSDGTPLYTGLIYVTRDGKVYARGSNVNLHLAISGPEVEGVESPQRLPLPGKVARVYATAAGSHALLEDGRVFGWGASARKFDPGVNIDQVVYSSEPAAITGPASIAKFSATQDLWLAVDAAGDVWSSNGWGNGPRTSDLYGPAKLARDSGLPLARDVSVGHTDYGAILGIDGTVWTVGSGIGIGDMPPGIGLGNFQTWVGVPRKVAGLPPSIVQVASVGDVGIKASYALDAAGNVWFWGDRHTYGLHGQEGAQLPVSEWTVWTPALLPLPGKAVSIAAQDLSVCAVLEDGSAQCYGKIFNEHLGMRFRLHSPIIELSIGGDEKAYGLARGKRSGTVHLRLADGTVWAWGQGRYGQLGAGIHANTAEPIPVSNEASTGDLDLDPATPNVPTASRPPFRVKTRLAGNLRTLSFSADVFGAATGGGTGDGSTNVYAFATADLSTWVQLDEQGQWSLLRSPVPAAASKVPLAGEGQSVPLNLLPQFVGTGLAGVRVFVGQGRDAQEMLQAQRFREVLELAPED